MKALLILSPEALELAYAEPVLQRVRACTELLGVIAPAAGWPAHRELLARAEVLFSGWGAPRIDPDFLQAAPALRAIFYAAGSVRYCTTPDLWERGIRLTTARFINAIPVGEYTAAAILLSLKRVWHFDRVTKAQRNFPTDRPMPGAYRSKVGLVSYGTIARQTRQRLRALEVEVLVYDPFLSEAEAIREQVCRVDLDTLFASADVVSLHTPSLPETQGLIGRRHFAAMRPGATFINTARGTVVNEPEMIAVLRARPDLQALLDVTHPEPPPAESPLYDLPNVMLTPHLAGSIGAECRRMGDAMVDEFLRFQSGQPLKWELTAAQAVLTA